MKHKQGFSLVELMVSVGLFAIVTTMATGAYLLMIKVSREAQATATGINNLSYAIESVTRNIRTGTKYSCPSASTISFTNDQGVTVDYRLNAGAIEEQRNGEGFHSLTEPAVHVDTLSFVCSGTNTFLPAQVDRTQANVRINVVGTVSAGPGSSRDRTFYLQTFATMRGIDL